MTLEYRIVRTDEHFPEEVEGPIPDLAEQRANLKDFCRWYPKATFRIEKRPSPEPWVPVEL